MHLSVRELTLPDTELLADYWTLSDDAHLIGMGCDLSKMPARADLLNMLQGQLQQSYQEKMAYAIIWLIDGVPSGHCNVNKIEYGNTASMHLHLWNSSNRKHGAGAELVKLSLPFFFRNLELQSVYSEPYALNDAPNRTLPKAGFTLEKEYVTIPGSLNFEQPVKRWKLSRERFIELYGQS